MFIVLGEDITEPSEDHLHLFVFVDLVILLNEVDKCLRLFFEFSLLLHKLIILIKHLQKVDITFLSSHFHLKLSPSHLLLDFE